MARTITNDPLQKFCFRVTIPGLPSGIGFQKVTGLSREIEVVEYHEGMTNYAQKLTGKEKVGEVTLERGMYLTQEMESYYKTLLKNPESRSTVVIEYLNRYGSVTRTYKLANAWASKWEGSDLDATSSDVAIEKITIQFEYFLD